MAARQCRFCGVREDATAPDSQCSKRNYSGAYPHVFDIPLPPVPVVTMQMLIDAGFNAFGLQLFIESFAGKINPEQPDAGLPFSFSFRGLRFTVEREPGEEIDTRHH